MDTRFIDAAAIGTILRSRQIAASVHTAIVAPGHIVYLLRYDARIGISKIAALVEDIEAAVHNARQHAAGVDIPVTRARLVKQPLGVEVSRLHPEPLQWRNVYATRLHTAVIGETITAAGIARPVLLDLSNPATPHALVAGTTGSGKSVMLRTIALTLAMANSPDALALYIADMRAASLMPLAGLPHTRRLVTTPAQTSAMLAELSGLLMETDRPRIVVIIDEVAALARLDKQAHSAAMLALEDIAARGRGQRMHLIAATQHPTARAIASLARLNMPAKIIGRVDNAQAAALATGTPGSGAERLPGAGAFIHYPGGQRLQCYNTTTDVTKRMVAALARHWPAPRKLIAPPMQTGPSLADQRRAAVLAAIANYVNPSGRLKHGWKTAAVMALHDESAKPTGNTWRRLLREATAIVDNANLTKASKTAKTDTVSVSQNPA